MRQRYMTVDWRLLAGFNKWGLQLFVIITHCLSDEDSVHSYPFRCTGSVNSPTSVSTEFWQQFMYNHLLHLPLYTSTSFIYPFVGSLLVQSCHKGSPVLCLFFRPRSIHSYPSPRFCLFARCCHITLLFPIFHRFPNWLNRVKKIIN